MSEKTTLFLELNAGEFLQSRVFKLESGWRLRFVLGKGVYGKAIKLVITPGKEEFVFKEPEELKDFDSFIDYHCENYGAFKYVFFAVDNPKLVLGDGFFHVLPEWHLSGGKHLSLNSISCVTHIAKLLGPLKEWKKRLMVAHKSGYNMVHLTPIQKLGISNSSYSIADYHRVNGEFGKVGFEAVGHVIQQMEDEWGMLVIQDVVWNHAARNAQWLQEHPECTFNCFNSPHLRPAYILDRELLHFSQKIAKGEYADKGLPSSISTGDHLGALQHILRTEILPALNLHEFFLINVDQVIEDLKTALRKNDFKGLDDGQGKFEVFHDKQFRRKSCSVNMQAAKRLLLTRLSYNKGDKGAEETVLNEMRSELDRLNEDISSGFQNTTNAIVNAVLGHVGYERVDGHGPRLHEVNDAVPLVTNYFLHPYETTCVAEDEADAFDPKKSKYLMACNGWVMNHDPMVNFAEFPSETYLRRELVCWGDCIKLNYGQKPSDCPYLWGYMTAYTEQCARIFHGVRIDNCHSTPIHVAEYLLAKARVIRPNLYVVAELFTGSEDVDHIFVNRLGITSLIREAQNAPDSHEQGRFVYRYGGDPVGAFRTKDVRKAQPGVAHALFFDQTHDNPPPSMKRTPYDYVPTAAMTSVAYCASGSTRGYDEFIDTRVDVVKETRLYSTWDELTKYGTGMVEARKLFNDMHFDLWAQGFTEIFVDQVNTDIVAVTRHNPTTHESVLVVSHCCFSGFNWECHCKELEIADDISEILFEVKTVEVNLNEQGSEVRFLAGNSNYSVEIYKNVPFEKSGAVRIDGNKIALTVFPSGSVVAFKITPKKTTVEACGQIDAIVSDSKVRDELKSITESLSLQKLNYLLYRCEKEDQAEFGEGAYEVKDAGKFVYCGLDGIYPVIKKIQQTNDLGHPVCSNLRDGTWICDYICRRIGRYPELSRIKEIFESCLGLLNNVPHFLRPRYFEVLFTYLRKPIVEAVFDKLSYESFTGTTLSKHLALNSIAFLADIKSARLPPIIEPQLGHSDVEPNSLSAGLPHFAEGIWRNWGRDTFIALPGLLLSTGRFKDARNIILAYAGTLRHGLIPNLLGEGKCSRYNCRDAVWFWLSAIIQFVEKVPAGDEILEDKVLRLYPSDDSEYSQDKQEPLFETINEALQRHFQGISFRERNAGHQIDEQMRDEGFNVTTRINLDTGFVEGGNRWNAGTWCDKMGSSDSAGNKGQPATPRDGAPVELQGLAVFVAEGLDRLHKKGKFSYSGLDNHESGIKWTWKEWADKLRCNFEKRFYVTDDETSPHVFRKHMIKDTFGSCDGYPDFQLRPNFAIALAAVPDLLPVEQSWNALKLGAKILLSPLGIKTLDPKDYAYHGNYNNDDQSSNKATANGWNYHQGPEWVWVAGLFLKALLAVSKHSGDAEKKREAFEIVKKHLFAFKNHIDNSEWRSLPELTNVDGSFCSGSCPAQAWSIGCAIEAVEALKESI